jgi:hypothetical protein
LKNELEWIPLAEYQVLFHEGDTRSRKGWHSVDVVIVPVLFTRSLPRG